MMKYYLDSKVVYFNLEKSGRKVYKNRFVELKKKNKKKGASYDEEASLSSDWLLSVDARVYFDYWFGNTLDDNQVCEDQIMGRIKVMAQEAKEGREKIREEVKAREARVMAKVITLKGAI